MVGQVGGQDGVGAVEEVADRCGGVRDLLERVDVDLDDVLLRDRLVGEAVAALDAQRLSGRDRRTPRLRVTRAADLR